MAKIIELIYTEERVGGGTEKDPTRMCKQLWTKDGLLVLNSDPCGKEDETEEGQFLEEVIFNSNNL